MANRKTAKKRFLKESKIKAYIESLKDLEELLQRSIRSSINYGA